MKTNLSEKMLRFCRAYLIDPNATKAAIKAGYSEKGAVVQGSRLLTNVKVREYLAEKAEKIAEKNDLTVDKVLQDLETIKSRCMEAEPVVINGDPTGDYKFNAQGALKAVELQGKFLKMFTDKHEITGKDGGPLETVFIVKFID